MTTRVTPSSGRLHGFERSKPPPIQPKVLASRDSAARVHGALRRRRSIDDVNKGRAARNDARHPADFQKSRFLVHLALKERRSGRPDVDGGMISMG
jgi:hypothetical protein